MPELVQTGSATYPVVYNFDYASVAIASMITKSNSDSKCIEVEITDNQYIGSSNTIVATASINDLNPNSEEIEFKILVSSIPVHKTITKTLVANTDMTDI
jgi:hypothetical protein